MTETSERPADEGTGHDLAIDLITGNLLRLGVILAGLVLLAGGSVFLYRHGTEPTPDRHRFEPVPEKYCRPGEMLRAVGRGEARALIQVGVLLLMATPLLRVLFTAVAFAFRGDVVYMFIALVVLTILLIGIWTGQTE